MEVPEPLRPLLCDPAPIERTAGAVALWLSGLKDEALLVMEEVLATEVPEVVDRGDDFVPACTTAHGAVLEFANMHRLLDLEAPARRLWDGLRDGSTSWNSAVAARALELLARVGDAEARAALEGLAHLPVRVALPVHVVGPPRGWLARMLRPHPVPSDLDPPEEDLTPLPAEEAGDSRDRATAAFCAARALLRLAAPGEVAAVESVLCRLPLDLVPHLRREDGIGHGALWFMAAASVYEGVRCLATTFVQVAASDGVVLGAAATAAAAALGDGGAGRASVARLLQGPGSVRGEEPAACVGIAQMLTLSRDPALRSAARLFLERCAAMADPEADGDPDDPAWVLAADARDLLRYHQPESGDPVADAVRRVRDGRPTDFVRWRY